MSYNSSARAGVTTCSICTVSTNCGINSSIHVHVAVSILLEIRSINTAIDFIMKHCVCRGITDFSYRANKRATGGLITANGLSTDVTDV